ncbi:hypothetical protein QBC35DRAFT_391287 [Podospora australis]|uniref:BTB domain-containing protein n=1 Tax=Podospora australis TaxID=1536484 RepID=A0AAN6WM48_9PEZI|nr:hypothetical protein QBC35DRAFT_391287 [Podospora australis]
MSSTTAIGSDPNKQGGLGFILGPCSAIEVEEIDPDGDLVLLVGNSSGFFKARRFRVSSSAMRRHSPVWKAMLFGPWKEKNPENGEWNVAFPDDSPPSFCLVLNIVHGRFDQVPTRLLALRPLYDLVVLLDKYDMVRIIRPWAKGMVQNAPSFGTCESLRRWTHIAWESGDRDAFFQGIYNAVLGISVDGKRLYILLLPFRPGTDPQHNLSGDIIRCRLSLIEELLKPFHTHIYYRLSARPWRPSKKDKGCDNMVLGSIWRQLLSDDCVLAVSKSVRATLLPHTKASEVTTSAQVLTDSITAILDATEIKDPDHAICKPGVGNMNKYMDTWIREFLKNTWWASKECFERMEARRMELDM